jgi:hypothetical protein
VTHSSLNVGFPRRRLREKCSRGPKTLEDLLAAAETVRPEGTLTRPLTGSDRRAVDKAWQAYDAAVQAATTRLQSAIDERLADASTQGNAEAVAAFELVKEAFVRRGALPSVCVPALRKEAAAAREAYKSAAVALEKEYQSGFGEAGMAAASKAEWTLLAASLDLTDEPQFDSEWEHVIAGREAATITFYSNGTIGSPDAPHTWTLKGDVLTIRWQNPEAPGGAWIDTCELAKHGGTYAGRNQLGTGISGKRVQ